MQKFYLAILILGVQVLFSNGHIRTMEPPNRSSIWRDPRFETNRPVQNLDDDGVYCGRIMQLPVVGDNCGVCGDPLNDTLPRPNESGGIYGKGIITGNYSAGQEIEVKLDVTIPHGGSFHFQICDTIPETDACFFLRPKLNITTMESGTVTDVPIIPLNGRPSLSLHVLVQLPTDLTCTQCVLRLNYRGSSNQGECEDGTTDYGCGLQQNFRSCSDISISA